MYFTQGGVPADIDLASPTMTDCPLKVKQSTVPEQCSRQVWDYLLCWEVKWLSEPN